MPGGAEREWLEADAVGGFASGTVRGPRTRRYHALLLAATTPPTGRMVLVNGIEAWVETASGRFALSTQAYLPDVEHPDGVRRIAGFAAEPWPSWLFALEDGTELTQEILVEREAAVTWLRWRLTKGPAARLKVRPLLSGRDYHALHHENDAFRFEAARAGARALRWTPYPGVPAVEAAANGEYTHDPLWFRAFRYEEERRRGLDHVEDLASPGVWTWDLGRGDAALSLRAVLAAESGTPPDFDPETAFAAEARRRAAFASPLARAASHYVVRRGTGRTILAGFPWFTDWGRDTFIALRGLCLATGRLDAARDILLAWAGLVSEGMLPNRFPDAGEAPDYNSVDASLWFVVAVHAYLAEAKGAPSCAVPARLQDAVAAILAGYRRGTRFGIRLDTDGLLAAGVPGLQLTWMDARIGERVVTPRIGKPVEIQALWLNALHAASVHDPDLALLFERGLASFRARFWREEAGCLHDVVDADHVPGRDDPTFRPNQILAVGGLPLALFGGEQARRIVAAVEARLLTPLGLRTLAPGEPGYHPHFAGGPEERDGAYHQGTAWPWLMGPFVEAWLRVHGSTARIRALARQRFVSPLLAHLHEAGLGHVSEVVDAEPPHRPGGCPFQAWSLGELLRILRLVDEPARTDSGEPPGP